MKLSTPTSLLRRVSTTALVLAASAAIIVPTAFAGTDSSDIVPTVEEATTELERVTTELAEAQIRIGDLIVRRDEIDVRIKQLGAEDQLLVERIEIARSQAREFAVLAYIQGGTLGDAEVLLEASGSAEFNRRAFLVEDQATRTSEAAKELDALMQQASEEMLALLDETDQVQREINTAISRVVALESEIIVAEQGVVIAAAWELSDYAVETGRFGEAPEEMWDKLRHCESTNNYAAVTESGKYRGAYQFDLETWKTVGGSGDPAAAAPLEQDARARALFASRGNAPWPECGRFLPQVS